jgi:hypothetical protein
VTILILKHLSRRLPARRILDQQLIDAVSAAGLVHPLNQTPVPFRALAPQLPAHLAIALAWQPLKKLVIAGNFQPLLPSRFPENNHADGTRQ